MMVGVHVSKLGLFAVHVVEVNGHTDMEFRPITKMEYFRWRVRRWLGGLRDEFQYRMGWY